MSGGGARGGRGGWVLAVVLVGVVALLVALSGDEQGRPYDLDDAGPAGYRGLRLLVEELGGRVEEIDAAEVGAALDRGETVFVPVVAGVGRTATRRWLRQVEGGGTLVLGTPRDDDGPQPSASAFSPGIVGTPPGTCSVERLADVRDIDPASGTPLEVPAAASSCFGDGRSAIVVEQEVGAGRLVTLATPDLFANDVMRPHDQEVDEPKGPMRDNVVLAARVLLPGEATRVAVVTSGLAGVEVAGDRGLVELLGSGVKLGIWQLVAAFGIYAWWRGRRHGRVVVEPQPVPIAGSELVAAVGNLMSRRADPARAASLLRSTTAHELAARLGVPRDTDPTVLASLVATRTRREPADVLAALAATPVTTDDDLVAVAARLEAIRTEVLHG